MMRSNYRRATERQRAVLSKILENTPYEVIENMSFAEADSMIAWNAEHWRGYPPTQRQQVFLRKWGLWKDNLNRGQAFDLIAEVKARTASMTPEQVSQEISDAQHRAVGFDWRATHPPTQDAP